MINNSFFFFLQNYSQLHRYCTQNRENLFDFVFNEKLTASLHIILRKILYQEVISSRFNKYLKCEEATKMVFFFCELNMLCTSDGFKTFPLLKLF